MAKDTSARMIEATARMLQHRGYHGTALSDILEASGAPRGSLYFHFPGGKDQLAIEATRAAVEETTAYLRDSLASAASPAEGVRAFVDATAELMRRSDYTFGCPVAPMVLDAPAGLHELDELCRRTFERWIDMLRMSFVDSGLPTRRATSLALLTVATIEGALLIARAYRDCAPITDMAAELEAIIAAAAPRGRTSSVHHKRTRAQKRIARSR
jgi:TetR/AcrR family transcriptional repressor of lmrAB and yxaGH operons